MQGAGKTSLYYALLGQSWATMFNTSDGLFPDVNRREGVAEGVAFVDPAGVNLQVCYDTSGIQRYFDFYDVCMLVFRICPTESLLVTLSFGGHFFHAIF